MNITRNKILLFGFIAVLLVGIPLTLYSIKTQQETRSRAQKATTLAFVPDSSDAAPIRKAVGEEFPLDIQVNPGTNVVSFVKLELNYDETKIATSEATDAFKVNEAAFPVTLEGPVFTPGKVAVTLSVGSDPTSAIQQITNAVTIKFKGIASTNGAPTNISFGNNTEVLSIGGSDQASENVLLNVAPAVVIIGNLNELTPTVTSEPSPTIAPSATLIPTNPPVPTEIPVPTAVPPTAGPTTVNPAPVCTALNIDRAATGTIPYSLTFTAVGNDSNGTISKVTFNYGDGPTESVTETGGIGTNTVSVQRAHTYTNPGIYTASVTITDNMQGISDYNSCKVTITIQGTPTSGGGGGTTPLLTAAPSATLAPGPGDTVVGIGAAAVLMMVIGGLLFLAL